MPVNPISTETQLKRLVLTLSALLLLILAAAYYALPLQMAGPLIALNRTSAGLTEHTAPVGPHTVHYLAGGTGTPVVLLHGIFAEKDHWVDFARPLTSHYQVMAPDLPGFGASGRFDFQSYGYAAQVERLRLWMDAAGIRQAHLAGNSMGGTLAALFARRYPQRVLSVAFIGAPHGLRTPQRSAMDRLMDAGMPSPLIAHNEAEFEQMLDLLFTRRPFLPYPVAQLALTTALENAPTNVRIWNEQLQDRFLLDAEVGALTHPVLALWGAQDRLFDVSGADVLRRRLKQADMQVLSGVGHLPMMEVPAESAGAYSRFLAQWDVRFQK